LSQYFDLDYKYFSSQDKSSSPQVSKNTLKNLISWWSDYSENSKKTSYDLIIVDEFQDLDPSMMKMLKKLYKINKKNDVKIIVAGDPCQTIYHYHNKGDAKNYFNLFGSYFGEHDALELNVCFRCSPSIQRFVNGYYKKQYGDFRQYNLSQYKPQDYSEDVFIHAIQHKKLLKDKICEIINKYPKKRIKIMGRVHKELKVLLDIASNNDLASVSTIHSEKGNECDVAIIVNTKFNNKIMSEADKNLWNVAITRAKETVHIVTSFPQATITQLFEDGTYTLLSDQKTLSTSSVPVISEEPIYLTIENLQKSMIDSIEIQLPEEDAPFIPYEKQNLEKKSPFMTDTRLTRKNINFVLHRHNEKMTFDCSDLSQLKNLGYNDYQIVEYILEAEKEYFQYHIADEQLLTQKIRRLDLARYIKVSSQRILDTLLLIFKLAKYSNTSKRTYCYENEEGVKTIYLNSLKSKSRGIRIYFPQFKKINPLNTDKTFLKVELYRVRESHKSNKDSIDYTVGELLNIIRDDQLETLYFEWLDYEFSFLKEKKVKNVEMHKLKRNISSFDDLKALIEKGNIAMREKRVYFYILLSFLSETERAEIMEVFPR